MITVRQMELEDLEQVMVIEHENFSVPWTETGFFSFLIRQDAIFLVAEEDNEILGYCGILTALDEGDITNVAVKQTRQRQGIGKKIITQLIHTAADAGVTTLHLEVRTSNEKAISLYEQMGFERVGIRRDYYEDPRESAVIMSRR